MALNREQYNSIMLGYTKRQNAHRHELAARQREIFIKIPAYAELDRSVSGTAVASLRQRLLPDADTHRSTEPLQEHIAKISSKKRELLLQHGYPPDYLEMKYDCPHCKDTGFIGNEKCSCFRRQEIAILYNESHLDMLASTNSFSDLSEEYYKGEDLTRFRKARDLCIRFVQNFDTTPSNLYFFGTVGTGKSLLSICAAHELIESGHFVLYFSAASLFDTLAGFNFRSGSREEYQSFLHDINHCDLLIIDDLGTELTNSFTTAQLFNCINERYLNRKSTVISTNLSLEEMQRRYSDRIFSRIVSTYELCKITGPDIRLLKKRRVNRHLPNNTDTSRKRGQSFGTHQTT